jgi:uncharacterized protein (DUF433 family)
VRCPLMMAHLPFVCVDPEIQGGQPCFTNTNIPLDALFVNLAAGERLDVIIGAFAGVSREAAVAILREACRLLRERALEAAGLPPERVAQLGPVMYEHDWAGLGVTESAQHYHGRGR